MTMIAGETRELFPKPPAPEALIGFATPLWGLFAGVAMSGVAWWWMTQWARPENLEAMFARTAKAPEKAVDLADAATSAAEPVLEALAKPELPPAPVGGEAAPIAPVVEALDAANEVAAAPTLEMAAPPEPRAVAPTPRPEPSEPRSIAPKAKPQARSSEPPTV
ncbi:hypothetical protein DJ021_00490 [Phenylobacterium hankyongense]|uniref:Uncharacterized protein n=1 Tax=Phenylobacterium hankyongense TaxID=1813876 RepID=A0A328ATD2_9CAUL|nr:hypothetical protein [Phenylobacterium hankyongense]RAK58392.1 hypothetical protein DJ021_00490 [Phenylobacterium hankyongense]